MKKINHYLFFFLIIFYMSSCGTGETKTSELKKMSFYDFIVEVDTKFDEIGDSVIGHYSNPIILENAFVRRVEVENIRHDNTYDPSNKDARQLKYILRVEPYMKTEDGKLVIITDLQTTVGGKSREPEHLSLAHRPCYLILNVFDEIRDSVFGTVHLSNEIVGYNNFQTRNKTFQNNSNEFYVSDISAKVVLKNITRTAVGEYNGETVTQNKYEFDLLELLPVKRVESDVRTKFERFYNFDLVKFFGSGDTEVNIDNPYYLTSKTDENGSILKPEENLVDSATGGIIVTDEDYKNMPDDVRRAYEAADARARAIWIQDSLKALKNK